MSPWLFNLFMDGVMKEFKANILNGGVKFGMGENAGKVSGLLFADDTTLMAESENNLQRYVSAFVRVCEREKLNINVEKSKVMKMSDTGEKGNLSIKVKEEVMKEVDTFRYLGVDFASNGRMDAELNHRSMEVRKCAGVLKSVEE